MNKLQLLIDRVNGFSKLGDNWDGYGAIPICKLSIENTINVLKNIKPAFLDLLDDDSFCPCPHGTIDIDIEGKNNEELNIELGEYGCNTLFRDSAGKYKGFEDLRVTPNGEIPIEINASFEMLTK